MPEFKSNHLVKPFTLKDGPEGLYPKQLFFMEGSDMEGFNGQFAYTIITETGSMHPVEGAIIHPYDEVLVFAGLYEKDILYLGAEISIEIGEERRSTSLRSPR
ncbi:MAG: hypothetical protein LBN35_03995 [Clostridiales Family XIII bacterium]|jgi:hypothetical protein|nr:hypothetical protein [Clostridiales Family XIII bacterium]